MYKLTFDPARKLITAHMSGFMTVEEVAAFSEEEQRAVAQMGCRSGEFLLLINTDGAVIQSQEVVAAFRAIVMESPFKAKRIAVVRHDALTRMQTRRILAGRDGVEIFETMAEASAWICSKEIAPALR